ncbi:MAG: hypothetical protein JXJ17_07400 [Anaerolineae bacterium]|nr:hypothetical protein [Anaerolineae bacterium]
MKYKPRAEWSIRPVGGIHGMAHMTRVLIWTQVLAQMVRDEGMTVDADALAWASVIHDTQRWSDGRDRQHGERAAAWLEDHREDFPESMPVEQIVYLCRWHVPDDNLAPEMTDDLKVFKDSDGLDRWRIFDLDKRHLRTAAAHRALQASHDLWNATRRITSPDIFETVLNAALRQGIIGE